MNVMTIVGTRPEIIKLSCVISELDCRVKHTLVHTGQNYDYELNGIFFEGMGIREPDIFLNAAGETAAETIGNVIIKTDALFKEHRPDALLLYGDTNSCLSVISAKRNRIPVFHMEAGNRCFDQRVPEELNRKVIDHLADINMTITEHARRYLISEGLRPETVIKTGSSMVEVLTRQKNAIDNSPVLSELGLFPGEYIIVSAHREENIDSEKNLRNFFESLNVMAQTYKKRVIVSTHPRTKKKLQGNTLVFDERVEFIKPLSFAAYIKTQLNAFCVVSDSGTITEESSILGFPAVMIRQAHERPEGMDQGTLIMSGLCPCDIVEAIDVVTKQHGENPPEPSIIPDYNVLNVSQKVTRIIMSYTKYVRRTVWKEDV
jgi:UDP-N-acetylglucosamine 2-epimerase (non-hydrolysing)